MVCQKVPSYDCIRRNTKKAEGYRAQVASLEIEFREKSRHKAALQSRSAQLDDVLGVLAVAWMKADETAKQSQETESEAIRLAGQYCQIDTSIRTVLREVGKLPSGRVASRDWQLLRYDALTALRG